MPPLVENVNEVSSTPIQKFYTGLNVFITGGTGFMGRLLIEKLLRSCPDIGNIYVLIREKKNINVNLRIDELLDDCIFEKLKNSLPKYKHKVHAIEGDCSLPNLGISHHDRKILTTEVSIVFHVAASVNFTQELKTAVNINVKGTREVINLCKEMVRLKAVAHVSTAYSNSAQDTIEERMYPTPVTPQQLINITDTFSDTLVEKITENILGTFPNTYAFTKAVAEALIQQEAKDLPIGVFRPSIIISTYKEPLQGWINNFYGAVGVTAGAGTGIIRVIQCGPEVNANIVPGDMCVNGLVALAWEIADEFQKSKNCNTTFDIPICQYESSTDQPINWSTYMELTSRYGHGSPSSNAIWFYTLHLITSYRLYQLAAAILHYLPALLADVFLFIVRKKPRFIKIYNKIHRFTSVLSYFTTKSFNFKSIRMRNIIVKMSAKDQDIFFCDLKRLDWNKYFETHFKGLRVYLLKDPLSTVPQALKRWKRLYWCHQFTKLILGYILIRFVWYMITFVYQKFI